MAAWSDGYFTDVQYIAKYFGHLAPANIAFACLRQGVRPPAFGPGSTYLELGCGQGFNLNVMAAANPQIEFRGVDFNPGQIANAQRLSRDARLANIAFEDLSFEQVLALPAGRLPQFDIIALHGVISWVSPENRALIVQILDRHLKPGGAVIVTYNGLPAWAAMLPLQRFVKAHFDRGTGEPKARALAAFRAAQDMVDRGAQGFAGPRIAARVKSALTSDPAYLIHEYFNDHFHPLYHAEVARELGAARLTFAASSGISEDMPGLAVTEQLRELVEQEADPVRRQSLLDYASDRQFRREIFVRGPNALGPLERGQMLRDVRFSLMRPPSQVSLDFKIPIGKLTGDPQTYGAVMDALADGPRSFAELRELSPLKALSEAALVKMLGLLLEVAAIHPADQSAGDVAPGKALNRQLAQRFLLGDTASHVAAPAAGTGVSVGFTELLALSGISEEKRDHRATARQGWELLRQSNSRLQKDGRALSNQAEHEAELIKRLEKFDTDKLPLFQRLGVI